MPVSAFESVFVSGLKSASVSASVSVACLCMCVHVCANVHVCVRMYECVCVYARVSCARACEYVCVSHNTNNINYT